MTLENIKEEIKELNKTDFVRLYLHITDEFNKMKNQHSRNTNQLIYNVKNPEKVKKRIYALREKNKKQSTD